MRVVPLAAVAVLVVIMLSACGSSHRHAALPGNTMSIETARFSARSHNYSVRQVKAAFASQGIKLSEDPGQERGKFISLDYGQPPHYITVMLSTKGSSGRTGVALNVHGRPVRRARHGNVVAFSDSGTLAKVKSALAALH